MDNHLEELSDIDKILIEKTRETMKKNYDYDTHAVCVGILDDQDQMFFGLALKCPNGTNTCGEPSALSNADINSKTKKYKSVVAVKGKFDPPQIIPPCGICRELFNFHCPNIKVIIDSENKIKAKKLLPFPYFSSRFPERLKKIEDD